MNALLTMQAHNLLSARALTRSPGPVSDHALRRACEIMMAYGDSCDYTQAEWLIHLLDVAAQKPAPKKSAVVDRIWRINGAASLVLVVAALVLIILQFVNGGEEWPL